jgi:hypothetical protein
MPLTLEGTHSRCHQEPAPALKDELPSDLAPHKGDGLDIPPMLDRRRAKWRRKGTRAGLRRSRIRRMDTRTAGGNGDPLPTAGRPPRCPRYPSRQRGGTTKDSGTRRYSSNKTVTGRPSGCPFILVFPNVGNSWGRICVDFVGSLSGLPKF